MHFSYTPQGVCSRAIEFDIDADGILSNIHFFGGCPGNTSGVATLANGRKASEVAAALKGTDCRGRGTSCPDQFAQALQAAIKTLQD